MLQRLYVDNYKCLVNFELPLQELSLLLGPNGAGKTSVLGAAQCALNREPRCLVGVDRFRFVQTSHGRKSRPRSVLSGDKGPGRRLALIANLLYSAAS